MPALSKLEERWLIGPKLLYFLINLQYYTLHQFRSAFAREKFMVSNSQYGKLTGIIMFITFFTNIAIGGYSDRRRNHRNVLLYLTLITAGLFALFYSSTLMDISIYNFWTVMLLYLVFNNPKQPLLDKIILDYLNNIPAAGPKSYGKQRLWGTIAYGAATYASEWCLTTAGSSEYNFNNLMHYSVITTILAAGAIVLCIRPGGRPAAAIERDVPKELPRGAPAEDGAANALSENPQAQPASQGQANQGQEGQISTRDSLTEVREDSVAAEGDTPGRSNRNEFITLLTDFEFLFFIFIMFSNAITRSAMSIYLNIYHREVLRLEPYDLPKSWPGPLRSLVDIFNSKPITTLTFFGISCEILVMFVSEGIINRMGLFWPLLLAQACAFVRFVAYYSLPHDSPHTYGLSCIFELIKGIYFGLAHISAVQIATRLAPAHLKATSQMIYQGTFNALGSLVSGLLFGIMFDAQLKGGEEDDKGGMFGYFFLLNSLLCMITILLYVYKYGLRDGVLTSRAREEEKLTAVERREEAMARGIAARA